VQCERRCPGACKTASMGSRMLLLGAAVSMAGALNVGELELRQPARQLAFVNVGSATHRRFQMLAPADAASCRRTRPCSCSEAGDSTPQTSRMAGGSDARGKKEPRSGEVDVQRGDELLVQEIPSMDSLEHDGASVKSLDERSAWQAYLSRILDGISALFSLACGSATLACMGVLECSTLATLGVFVASLSTAIGSLMVVATAAVGVLALLDTLRTSANDEDADDDALQALAAPPRRLGSMGGKKLQ